MIPVYGTDQKTLDFFKTIPSGPQTAPGGIFEEEKKKDSSRPSRMQKYAEAVDKSLKYKEQKEVDAGVETDKKADADAVTTMPAIGVCVSSGSDGGAVDVMVQGVMHDASAFPTFTVGNDVYVSTTAGAVQTAAPSGSGDTVQKVGVAIHADKIYFNFNTTEVLLA